MAKSLKDLKEASQALGYKSKAEVFAALESGGLGGKFNPALWKDYIALLVIHAQSLESARSRIEHVFPEPDPCPVCGSETQWKTSTLWVCSKGGERHYWLVRANSMLVSIGVNPIDYEDIERSMDECSRRDEIVGKMYWRAINGCLTDEEYDVFEEAYGTKVRGR